MRPTSTFLALALAACSSEGVPGGNAVGSGSSTLTIQAQVQAENLVPNASQASDYSTRLEVNVFRAGHEVTDATVTVTSDSGAHDLTYSQNGRGRYGIALVGYEQRYVLDVQAGTDFLTGVRVDGPSLHVFSAPALGAEVQGGQPLTVTWDRSAQAKVVHISTEQMDDLTIEDTGSFVIPADGLKHETDKVTPERIRLWCENQVIPAGALAGSSFVVDLRNQIDLAVLP